MSTTTTITIDIQNSLYAKYFDNDHLIHQEEFETLKGKIKNRIDSLDKDKNGDKEIEERRSEAYTVLGTRGSGKSSFLYSFMHWCREKEQAGDILVLDLIDPTLFESKGHIMLTIIAQLKHLVDETYSKRVVDNGCCVIYKEWNKKLESLARGIPSINGGDFIKENWMEPGFVMNQGIQDVYSAYTLEKSFNEFVDCSLKFLGKKLLVIVFDDIDIDFRRGWEVLETVRKYLTSKQIFVIISGDIRLFSKSIRKVQWKNFGKALLKNEEEVAQKRDYNNLVTEMESQYLQKILPTQYRIYLKSLLDIIGNETYQILIGNESISDYYKSDLFPGYNIENPIQTKVFVDFLLSMPLRTQIQLLNALSKTKGQIGDLIMPFASHLLDNGINYDDLIRFPNKLNAIIIKFLITKQIVEENYQLQPNTLDEGINACLVALSLVSSRHYECNAYLLFDYMIRVGFLRYVKYSAFKYAEKSNKTSIRKLLDINLFVKHTQLYNDIDLKVSIGNANAYLDGIDFKGTTKIYGFEGKAKDGGKINRIDTVFNEEVKSIERALGLLPLTISKYYNKQSSKLNYSVVSLLAAITDIVRESSVRSVDYNNIMGSDRGKTILEFLNYLSQIRHYMIPVDGEDNSSETEAGESNDLSIDKNDKDVSKFVSSLSQWIDAYPKVILPPYLLGKIATRAFASINSLVSKNDANLGEAMHRRIVIFLNAVLVEEAREYGYNLNNNNPSGSDKIFVDNLKKFKKISEGSNTDFVYDDLKLFNWIVRCPLLLSYMNLTDGSELYKCFDKLSVKPSINIFGYIEKVEVIGGASATASSVETSISATAASTSGKITFGARNKSCYAIVSEHFETPDDLFGDFNVEEVRNKLRPYFKRVTRKSVKLFYELNGRQLVW